MSHLTVRVAPCLVVLLVSGCTPGQESLTFGELVRACVKTTACGVKAYPAVANCVSGHELLSRLGKAAVYDPIFKCVDRSARRCSDVLACFGHRPEEGSCDTSFAARCEGDLAVSCDSIDKRVYSFDCAAAGLTCGVPGGGSFEARCTSGSCDTSFVARCEGNRLLTCDNGLVVSQDCAADGLVCTATACVGDQAQSCDSKTFQRSCDGSVAVICAGGQVDREDCAAGNLKRACQGGICVASNGQCTLGEQLDRCEGDLLLSCIDGRWERINCRDLDLGPCLPAHNGAACTPPPEPES